MQSHGTVGTPLHVVQCLGLPSGNSSLLQKPGCRPIKPVRCTDAAWWAAVACPPRVGCRKTAGVELVVGTDAAGTAARQWAAAASRPSTGRRRRRSPGLWTFRRGRRPCRQHRRLPGGAACRHILVGERDQVASRTDQQDLATAALRHSCTAVTTGPPAYTSHTDLLHSGRRRRQPTSTFSQPVPPVP